MQHYNMALQNSSIALHYNVATLWPWLYKFSIYQSQFRLEITQTGINTMFTTDILVVIIQLIFLSNSALLGCKFNLFSSLLIPQCYLLQCLCSCPRSCIAACLVRSRVTCIAGRLVSCIAGRLVPQVGDSLIDCIAGRLVPCIAGRLVPCIADDHLLII